MMDKSMATRLASQCGLLPIVHTGMEVEWWSVTREELFAFAKACYAAGQHDVAAWVESQRNDIPTTGQEFADAIRARTKDQT